MTRRPTLRVFMLCLGLFLALGMNLSAVQASEMAVQMAMASDSGAAGHGDCDGCGSSGDDDADALTCFPVLNCSGMAAVLPAERTLAAAQPSALFFPQARLFRSLASPPDPSPPRSSDLG